MNEPAHIEIRILSQPRYLCAVRAAIETLVQRIGLGEKQAGQVVMAVDEAVTNVIRHGYRDVDDRPITIRAWPKDMNGRSGLWLEIEDETQGISPKQIEAKPDQPQVPGGLGVRLIQDIMDEVRYEQRPDGKGLLLTMFKAAEPIEAATSDKRETQA